MDIFEKALIFATEKHEGQVRKSGHIPYIIHPAEVAAIVATLTDDREVMAAAVLHDTVEDTDTTLDEIRAEFGERVAYLVGTETENKRKDRPSSETWLLRKEETLAKLKESNDIDVKRLWLSDKLSNMRSFYRLHNKIGNELWQRFNQKDPKMQEKYYRFVAEMLKELEDTEAYNEYIRLMNSVFE